MLRATPYDGKTLLTHTAVGGGLAVELIPDFLEETKRLDKYSATKKVLGK